MGNEQIFLITDQIRLKFPSLNTYYYYYARYYADPVK